MIRSEKLIDVTSVSTPLTWPTALLDGAGNASSLGVDSAIMSKNQGSDKIAEGRQ